jgi:glycosyltransferase involved in cell wall biosynthesis
MDSSLISIIILTVDRHNLLDHAIESVVTQTYTNWEIILVQDGDNEKIKTVVGKWLEKGTKIVHIERNTLGTYPNALNAGIRSAKGKYIAILDDDEFWISNSKLDKQIQLISSSSDIVVVGGYAQVIDEKGKFMYNYTRPIGYEDCLRNALFYNPIVHSTALYKKQSALEVGLYDETISRGQDWDFFLKLMKIGRVINIPEVLSTNRIWNGGTSTKHNSENTISYYKIITKHKNSYTKYYLSLIVFLIYYMYGILPEFIRANTYIYIAKLKKKYFVKF